MILQTQVPDDWDDVTLGGVLSYEQPTRYIVQSPIASEGEIPVLTPGKSLLLGYSEETFGRYDKVPIILFDDFTTSCQWVDYQFKVKSSACKILRARDESVNLRFMFELLKQINYVPADHKRHWISTFAKETVRIPAIEEQDAIVGVLSEVDELVESLQRLIAKKSLVMRGAMASLLNGRVRLAGNDQPWPLVKLGEIANIKTGSRNNQDKSEDGSYPFFVRSATVERIGSYSYTDTAILIPGEGGIGSIFHYVEGPHEVHQRVYRISSFKSIANPRFVFWYLKEFFGPHAMQNTVKATVDSLRLPTFQFFELALPPSAEQDAIAEVLTDMDAEIEALEARLAKTRDLKTGMAQELLSGRTRLV